MINESEIKIAANRLAELDPKNNDISIDVTYKPGGGISVQVYQNDLYYEVKDGLELMTIVDCLVKLSRYDWM